MNSTSRTTSAVTHCGMSCPHGQYCTYLPATVISAMHVVAHTAQYVHPFAKPAKRPMNSSAYSEMLPDTGRYTSNSPSARMMTNTARPAVR